ncbi:MAG TPA: hypothetical protein VK145_00805 [Candidatus Nanoarchaeia archaeon]|nr:hypothetical protein [Candidatus Nanoarchaeia archaeon]
MNNKTVSTDVMIRLHVLMGIVAGITLFATLLFAALPHISRAATYACVNTSGSTAYVGADSSSDAFANSTNIASNSGVMFIGAEGVIITNTNQAPTTGYLYVNTSGVVTNVSADSSVEAFKDSVNISSNSGVMVIDSVEDSNMTNDQVRGI